MLARSIPLASRCPGRSIRHFWWRASEIDQRLALLEEKLAASEQARLAQQQEWEQHREVQQELQRQLDVQEMKIALLVDAENTSSRHISMVMAEVSRFGTSSARRIYGDWTTTQLTQWKPHLQNHAIVPVQQFTNTKGKNSTDSAMIIDAMDLMHTGRYDAFCLVTSDADFVCHCQTTHAFLARVTANLALCLVGRLDWRHACVKMARP